MNIAILPILSYVFAVSISPGPANIMSASYGSEHGFFKAQRFVIGATLGFTALTLAIVFGINVVATEEVMQLLRVGGSLYLMWVGFSIARSMSNVKIDGHQEDAGFIKGFLLQWINPKSWICSTVGVSAFCLNTESTIIFMLLYFPIVYLSLSFWSYSGDRIAKYLSDERYRKLFNWFLGGALIATAAFILFG